MSPIAHIRGDGLARLIELHRHAARDEVRRGREADRAAADDGNGQCGLLDTHAGTFAFALALGGRRARGGRAIACDTAAAILGQVGEQPFMVS